MPKARSKSKMNIQIPASLLGLLVSWAITVLMLCVGAIFITNEYIEINLADVLSVIIVFLSSLIGCLSAKISDKSNALMNIILISVSYIMSLIITGMLFFDGIIGRVFVEILAVFSGALIVLLFGNKDKKAASIKKRRKAYR